MDNRIKLNVGGSYHEITKPNILKYPNTLLARFINDKNNSISKKDEDGRYFFDRNPLLFPFILDFYRTGNVVLPTIVKEEDFVNELSFWGIDVKLDARLPNLNDIVNYNIILYKMELVKDSLLGHEINKNFYVHIGELINLIKKSLNERKRVVYAIFPAKSVGTLTDCFNFISVDNIITNKYEIKDKIYLYATFENSEKLCIKSTFAFNETYKTVTGIKVTF
jgi:hypothetical protein